MQAKLYIASRWQTYARWGYKTQKQNLSITVFNWLISLFTILKLAIRNLSNFQNTPSKLKRADLGTRWKKKLAKIQTQITTLGIDCVNLAVTWSLIKQTQFVSATAVHEGRSLLQQPEIMVKSCPFADFNFGRST